MDFSEPIDQCKSDLSVISTPSLSFTANISTANSIPVDLLLEILSRLPLESVGRFCCVSKLWRSMLRSPYFTELFLTRSSTRPSLLFAIHGYRQGPLFFFSSRQPQNPYEKPSSLLVDAGFHIEFLEDDCDLRFCGYASGLICFSFRHTKNPKEYDREHKDTVHVICNPSTGQCTSLPKLKRRNNSESYLGFDPISKQFKVLSMAYDQTDDHRVLTLGSGDMRWRKIQCPSHHLPVREGICVKGVLYCFGERACEIPLIVCFDVRSEKFKILEVHERFEALPPPKLINYKGKLGGIKWDCVYADDESYESYTRVIHMWVLEDLEKQEWSEYVYTLPENESVNHVSVAGVTATGEVVLSVGYTRSKKVDVFYFNPEKNSLQRVDMQGFEECDQEFDDGHYFHTVLDHVEDLNGVYAFMDHVEDLHVDDAKLLNSGMQDVIKSTPEPQKSHTSGDLCNSEDVIKSTPKPQKPHTSGDLCNSEDIIKSTPEPQKPHTSGELSNSAPSVKKKQPTILLQNKFGLLAIK